MPQFLPMSYGIPIVITDFCRKRVFEVMARLTNPPNSKAFVDLNIFFYCLRNLIQVPSGFIRIHVQGLLYSEK